MRLDYGCCSQIHTLPGHEFSSWEGGGGALSARIQCSLGVLVPLHFVRLCLVLVFNYGVHVVTQSNWSLLARS